MSRMEEQRGEMERRLEWWQNNQLRQQILFLLMIVLTFQLNYLKNALLGGGGGVMIDLLWSR